MALYREVRLKSRPEGMPQASNFEIASVDLSAPGDGEVQVRNLFMSVDPYMRGRMYDRPSYVPPFQIGQALQGGAIGTVVASNDPSLKEGDVVFVSAAAGAVGSIVCQIAKIKGHTVIGSAGGPQKAAFLKEIGVDHVIDYKATKDLTAALLDAAPKGIDVYFENVGGEHLEAAITAARPFARFALCGMISQYNETGEPKGPSNIIQAVGKSLRLEGFIVSNHYDMHADFLKDMSAWIGSGKMKWKDTVDTGIEAAPGAFIKLFKGENMGKMLVKLS